MMDERLRLVVTWCRLSCGKLSDSEKSARDEIFDISDFDRVFAADVGQL